MRFLDPVFLWGLAAIAVPIALHLFLRRRVPMLDFPLQRLVLRAEHSRQPRKKLNRVLLLITRAAILALLSLALARATLGGGGSLDARGPVAAVIVVDDSLSMRARAEDGGSVLERGLEAAESIVATFPEGSRVTVLRASQDAGAVTQAQRPLASVTAARAALSRIEPTFAHVALGDAMRAAMTLLNGASKPDRRLVLVTDLARHSLADLSLPRWEAARGSRPRLQVIAPRRESGPNFSVSGLDAAALPGGRLRVTARVSAWDLEGPLDSSLELRSGALGDATREVARAKISVGPGASEERRFEIAAPPEDFGESVASLPEDVLIEDNVRHCAHRLDSRASVLVVDGDPQNLAIASEAFYLENALAPGVGLDVDADVIPLPELVAGSVEGRAALLLCNARELSPDRARAIEGAVRAGAGLVVALGNRVDPAAYAAGLAAILPARLGLPRALLPPATIDVEPGLEGAGFPDLSRVEVRQHFMLEPVDGARVLLRLRSGEPLLVERRLGDGNVLLLGTTLDRDWTDLPISPGYLAFLRRLIERASPPAESHVLDAVRVGERVDLAPLALAGPASVRAPDGSTTEIPAGVTEFTKTSQPGVHVVSTSGRVRAAVVVVVDPVESDLSRISPDELGSALRGSVDGGAALAESSGEAGGLAAWKALLALLLVACAAESWLARRSA